MKRNGQNPFTASLTGLRLSVSFFWGDSFFRLHGTPPEEDRPNKALTRLRQGFVAASLVTLTDHIRLRLPRPDPRITASIFIYGRYQYENADKSRPPGTVNAGPIAW